MYLSRIAINKQLRKSRQALAFPEIMHAAVMSSFPPGSTNEAGGGKPRVLWRTDHVGEQIWLYVLGEAKPDFQHIVEQFGWRDSEQLWETKEYDGFLDRLSNGQKWHFRLHANPVHTFEGKIAAHVSLEHQKQWLRERAEKNGFSFQQIKIENVSHDAFNVIYRDTIRFKKQPTDKTYVTLSVATFEGGLIVEDAGVLKQALYSGIGKAKAYGCGLLTLANQNG